MEEEKITLDRESFKTLASESRIDILKGLKERRKTLTELSKELGLSASTVKEHMEKLSQDGLIKQKDDGHKWKYYELTGKGKEILNPGETKIWLILSASVLGMFYFVYRLWQRFYHQAKMLASEAGETTMRAPGPEAASQTVSGSSTYAGFNWTGRLNAGNRCVYRPPGA